MFFTAIGLNEWGSSASLSPFELFKLFWLCHIRCSGRRKNKKQKNIFSGGRRVVVIFMLSINNRDAPEFRDSLHNSKSQQKRIEASKQAKH
jgi:hypothetical protein